MHFSNILGLVAGLLSLAAVINASPVAGLEKRVKSAPVDTACSRRDVQLVSRLIKLTSKPQELCANFLPRRRPIEVKSTSSARDLGVLDDRELGDALKDRDVHESLEARSFRIPTALKRYGTALLTQACKCLYPAQEETPTVFEMELVAGFPSGRPCIYARSYTNDLLVNQDADTAYQAAGIECREQCRAESQCRFAWVGVQNDFGIPTALCYKDSSVFSSTFEDCDDTFVTYAVRGYNKVERTTT